MFEKNQSWKKGWKKPIGVHKTEPALATNAKLCWHSTVPYPVVQYDCVPNENKERVVTKNNSLHGLSGDKNKR